MSHTALLTTICLLGISSAVAAAAQAERILIDGSTGVTPLVQALAKAYTNQNSTAIVDIGKGLGTKARIQALSDGKIDIAMASHGLDVTAIKSAGMTVQEIGKIAVVFGVNASVGINDLSESQICDIYAGKMQNWRQLGAPDLVIVPLTRPESEVDTEVVREKIRCLKTVTDSQSRESDAQSAGYGERIGRHTRRHRHDNHHSRRTKRGACESSFYRRASAYGTERPKQ
jgi:phosphate transport system substrate-binding protein